MVFPQELRSLVALAGGFELCEWFYGFKPRLKLDRAHHPLLMVVVLRRTLVFVEKHARRPGEVRAGAMAALVLKRGAPDRLRAGHPWIYRGEIADMRGAVAPGRRRGRARRHRPAPRARPLQPPHGLACRLLTGRDEARRRRRSSAGSWPPRSSTAAPPGSPATPFASCWSEADGLPGLVVDRLRPVTVLQCQTLGMSRLGRWVAAALGRRCRAAALPGRRRDGRPHRGLRAPARLADPAGDPAPAEEIEIADGPCRLVVTIGDGHKTGLYLDQRDNHPAVAAHAAGRRVLDAFCYTGAFACHALLAGAAGALLVDSSAEALAGARRNLDANGVAERAELREANAFDELRQLEARRERFGVVVLDPPPFTRRKDALDAAARGYKEINLRGLRLLEPGGVLATFSCSHHVTPELFESICRDAAGDAGVTVRVLAALRQARDHPVLLNVPETRYLTGLLLQAV